MGLQHNNLQVTMKSWREKAIEANPKTPGCRLKCKEHYRGGSMDMYIQSSRI